MVATIVAVFDDKTEAQSTRDDLVRAGFRDEDIHMMAEQYERETGASRGEGGFWAGVREFFGIEDTGSYEEAARRGGTVLAVDAPDEKLDRATEILEKHRPIDLNTRMEEWRQSGWKGSEKTSPKPSRRGRKSSTEESIPVVEEQLRVGKRREERGGVRVYSRVTEKPVEEDVQLRDERVHVERRPADRPAGAEAFRERTIEATEMHEEPVIGKEARVVEEVVLNKDVDQRTEKVRDTVRRTEVDVERMDEDFRSDFSSRYANQGFEYQEFKPAYSLGVELANEPSMRNRDWNDVEPQARQRFEAHGIGSWDDARDAVRHGFERSRSSGR